MLTYTVGGQVVFSCWGYYWVRAVSSCHRYSTKTEDHFLKKISCVSAKSVYFSCFNLGLWYIYNSQIIHIYKCSSILMKKWESSFSGVKFFSYQLRELLLLSYSLKGFGWGLLEGLHITKKQLSTPSWPRAQLHTACKERILWDPI